jgi:selenocysteine-specific elongation factor
VPGHEAFVRTMVAGATGIDLALVVVAADEGVMPQTREHLAILELLGVEHGVIALTKCDLVDEEWLALVEEEVKLAAQRALPNAAVVPTSANTGKGIPELKAALAAAAANVRARDDSDLFRLPVDRAFTIKGTGTVVTGTVWSGRLARDETVRILPGELTARVRGVQAHGHQVDAAISGARAAVALAGVDVADVPRGSTLIVDKAWRATRLIRADVSLVRGADVAIRPRSWVRLHVGTVEVGARIVARNVTTDAPFSARIVLDEPVLLRGGDRFVIRSTAPLNTIAGGVVTDPYAPKRARPWPAQIEATERVRLMIDESAGNGVEIATLAVRLGVSPKTCRALVDGIATSGEAVVAGAVLVSAALVAKMRGELIAAVKLHHAAHPLEPGIPGSALRARLRAGPQVVEKVLAGLLESGELIGTSGSIAQKQWAPKLIGPDAERAGRILERLGSAGAEPPSAEELAAEFGGDPTAILRFLERRGEVVQVEDSRYYKTEHLQSLIDKLRAAMSDGAEASPSDIRDALSLSRKYLIPLLGYCDRAGYTNRSANGRVWRGT